MFDFEETPEQRDIADHYAYLLMKDLHYTDAKIASHMSYTKQQLADLIAKFTIEDDIEQRLL